MTDRPATTYVVSVFEKPHWRTVLTTKEQAEGVGFGQGDRRQGAGGGNHSEAEEALKRELAALLLGSISMSGRYFARLRVLVVRHAIERRVAAFPCRTFHLRRWQFEEQLKNRPSDGHHKKGGREDCKNAPPRAFLLWNIGRYRNPHCAPAANQSDALLTQRGSKCSRATRRTCAFFSEPFALISLHAAYVMGGSCGKAAHRQRPDRAGRSRIEAGDRGGASGKRCQDSAPARGATFSRSIRPERDSGQR